MNLYGVICFESLGGFWNLFFSGISKNYTIMLMPHTKNIKWRKLWRDN